MDHQRLSHTDQHPADILLLAAGEVVPQLMGGYRIVAWRRRTGAMGWHYC
jgi:hypothetical protein